MPERAELQALIDEQKKKSAWPGAFGQAGASVMTGQRMGTAQAIATFLQGLAGGYHGGKEGQQTQLQALLKQKMDMEKERAQIDEIRARIGQVGIENPMDILNRIKGGKEVQKMDIEAKTQKNKSLAEQNLGAFQDPSQFEGMAPEDQELAKSSVRSAMLSQDPKVWNEFSKENTRVDELNRKEAKDEAAEKYRDNQYKLSERRTEAIERRAAAIERRAEASERNIHVRLDKLPTGIQQEFNDTKSIYEQILEAEALYNPDHVGAFDSSVGWVKGKTGWGADDDEQTFRTVVNSVFNQVGKLRAGAAWTAGEIARLKNELPTTSTGEVDFKAKIKNIKKVLESKMNNIVTGSNDRQKLEVPVDTNKKKTAPMQYDAEKEDRYQKWKASQGIK